MNPLRHPEHAASLAASLLGHAAIVAGLLVPVLSGEPTAPALTPLVVELVLTDAAGSPPSGDGETAPEEAAQASPPPPAEEVPAPAEPETAEPAPTEPETNVRTEAPPVPETPPVAPATPAPVRKPRPPASNPVPRPAPAGEGSGPATPAAAPTPSAPGGAGEPDSPPRPAGGNPVPAYPRSAQRAGVEGTVLVRVTVRPDGTAGAAEVAASSGDAALDAAARAAVAGWRFVPAMRGGVPVPAVIEVPVRFQLTGRRGP